ncbi:MAG: outer membrane protein assembly factor, partial [Devosiaceae bacterium]|nr:outer membrane protein assembly factor [Devosiaceae bacterium MH13]
ADELDAAPIGEAVAYSIEVTVTPEPDPGDLTPLDEEAIAGASALWQGREGTATGLPGLPGLLAEARGDYRRVLGALYAQGRYGGAISITANGREVADLPPDAALGEPIALAIRVNPGPAYRFGRIEIAGAPPATSDPRDVVPQPREIDFVPGRLATSGTIRRAEQIVLDGWREQGYALAERLPRQIEADHETRRLDVRIGVEPGPIVRYGAVTVEGTDRMDPDYVAWMTGLVAGETYDPDDIAAAQDRLAGLDVFRSVRVVVGDAPLADGSVPVTVVVQERPRRRFGFGGNVSTTDGLGLEAYWLHRNLFGRAERLRIDGRVSGITSLDPEDFTYRFSAALRTPGIVTPDTVGTASLELERAVLEAYTKTGGRLAVGVEHPFTPELTGRLEVEGRHAEFDDDVFGQRSFTTAGFTGGLVFDTRDNPTDATEGVFLELTAAPFYEFSRQSAGIGVTAEARAYQSFGADDRFTLAGRVRTGTLLGPSAANTAPDRLFLAGGGGSVRGYAFRNIGVEQPGGDVIGGRFLAEGSLELRGWFTDTLGGVVFADAGYVDADSFGGDFDDLKVGVGAGLRYRTPIGPVRLDVAVPLDPGVDDPDFGLYLGVGQTF